MQWFQAGAGALALVLMTGCPSEFGRDGRIDEAVHKDAMELSHKHCTPDERAKVCAPGQEDTRACRECGQ